MCVSIIFCIFALKLISIVHFYSMKRIFSFGIVLLLSVVFCSAQPRYIFYLIGDGMGVNEVLAAEMYRAELEGRIGRVPLCMTQFPVAGYATTFSASNGITDSSAAGTCLASGKKTQNGHLGTTPDDEPIESIAERLHNDGWAVGITTSVAIDHATPGAFYAHVHNRDEYYTIGTQLPKSDFEFFGGAGFHQPTNKSVWEAPNLYDLCENSGYKIAHGYKEAEEMVEFAPKMILIQEQDGIDREKKSESLPFAIDRKEGALTLSQIARTAVRFLEKRDRFFLMIEGGKIDYAGHSKDGATNVCEVLDFDMAVQVAFDFYCKHPDETLIVVTADHETGGMALGNSDYTLNLQLLQNQHMSQWELSQEMRQLYDSYGKKLKWEQVKQLLTKSLGFYEKVAISAEEDVMLQSVYKKMVKGKGKNVKTLYADLNEMAESSVRLLNQKSKLGWTTFSHSAAAVPVFAIGKGSSQFGGWHDNSELAPMILRAAGY